MIFLGPDGTEWARYQCRPLMGHDHVFRAPFSDGYAICGHHSTLAPVIEEPEEKP